MCDPEYVVFQRHSFSLLSGICLGKSTKGKVIEVTQGDPK